MRLENADNFEGFHISQPSYWNSKHGMVIVTCEKCGHRGPAEEEKIPIATTITCVGCGYKSIKSDKIGSIIRWWEHELSGDERSKLLGEYVWSGDVESRHKKLREMHQTYKSDKLRSE